MMSSSLCVLVLRGCVFFLPYLCTSKLDALILHPFGGLHNFWDGPVSEQTALNELDSFEEKWGSKYPKIAGAWRENWANLSTYFKYPKEMRSLIYTTNAIEGFNRQLRKVTKSKSVFPTDDSLLKMLYLAMMDITKKWTGRRREWGVIHSQLEVYFADRIS